MRTKSLFLLGLGLVTATAHLAFAADRPKASAPGPAPSATPAEPAGPPPPAIWTLADMPAAVTAPILRAVGDGVILKIERQRATGEGFGGDRGSYRVFFKNSSGSHELRVSEKGEVLSNG